MSNRDRIEQAGSQSTEVSYDMKYYEDVSLDEKRGIQSRPDAPTDEELKTLRRVADHIPFKLFTIAFVELCERFSYYGSVIVKKTYNLVTNFIQQPLPPGSTTGRGIDSPKGQPGALGMGQQASTGITTFNQFWQYFMPLFGAWVADKYWGRYKTICIAIAVDLVGHLILISSAIPPVITKSNENSLAALLVGMITIGFATGGFKPNISPLITEQLEIDHLTVRTMKDGERVIVDPAITINRVYNWFYLFINIGALVGQISMVYAEKYVGFWLSFTLPTLNNNLVSQAATMKLNGLPNDILSNLDPLALLIFIPLCDLVLYPTLRKMKIRFTPIRKITFGFFTGSAAMVWACVLQYYIYKKSVCGDNASGNLPNGEPCPNVDILVWAQTGAYVLIALSEIFASITSLEYAFSKAPKNMRSMVQAVALFMSAISAALGQAFTPLSADPYLVWNYGIVAVLAAVAGAIFWVQFRGLDAEEDAMNELPEGRVGAGTAPSGGVLGHEMNELAEPGKKY
ncbi:putative peptide transporter ptr2 [Colletotrichum sp. SAR11_240]|nr:putative peptide transporter ptr2 [Colletotrichum sp. SAR11_240]